MQEVASSTASASESAAMPQPRRQAAGPVADLNDPALYINRQISWLDFNERVLNEAINRSWPLLERVKFLSIFYSNLDEFFMIRVAGLHEQLEAAVSENTPDGLSPGEQLS